MLRSVVLLATASCCALATAAPATCRAVSGAQVARVIELYTSEGCNSCPPADRWLSALKGQSDVIALAFHVDYWDRLGWKDRFASPGFTERQYQIQRSTQARFVYTPQVVVGGLDWRGWPGAALPPPAAATVNVELRRDGDTVQANITPAPGATGRLAAYWALTENDHRSAVKAGENSGVTLAHDHVVRSYATLGTWPAAEPRSLRFEAAAQGEGGRPRRTVLVVHEAVSGRPVQALALDC